ncbi:GAF and ANTAR domain-containing protein [Nocardia blacklockiae]|uniref:GAF and ANTAR domain-containing protein n=1 Tax=Nocardia blacklockiae TaxID=480036 RepID=UPI001893858D|nr:GAF and ANTAR domain-containing protein [Nocardia blacklockiae]MBF6172345.1 GAF and ANTAR domain-containing protein [Nocardia blacklockiae]
MNEREGPLVKAFVELADTLVADYDVIELAQRLVDDCVRLLAVDAAGILLAAPGGGLQVLASTTEQARLLELFQVQSEAGPCLLAYRSGGGVLVEDLTVEPERWPAFARRAIADGFGAVCALPLRLREERIGALNLFSATAGALSAQDVLVGQALADIATIGILHQRAATRSETINQQLQTALNTRIIIEQAKGMLAERGRLDMDHAFLRLRTYARANNLRLTELARAVVQGTAEIGTLLGESAP